MRMESSPTGRCDSCVPVDCVCPGNCWYVGKPWEVFGCGSANRAPARTGNPSGGVAAEAAAVAWGDGSTNCDCVSVVGRLSSSPGNSELPCPSAGPAAVPGAADTGCGVGAESIFVVLDVEQGFDTGSDWKGRG